MPDRAFSDSFEVQVQLDRLAQVSLPRDVLGFARIQRLLAAIGNPERLLPPVLHVAGTNGKGSTCAFLRGCIEAAGLTAHVYTSPHLVNLNERIRVAGRLIADGDLAALLRETIDAVRGEEITFFEATTAAAFLAFARTPADACIVEVGIGGRLDATNIVPAPCVCGISSLGLDHAMYLGETLEEIAAEKAGIAKPGIPLVTQTYPPEAMVRIGEAANAAGAPWYPRGGEWDAAVHEDRLLYRDSKREMSLPRPKLAGTHQGMNAALAVAMLRHQDVLRIPDGAFATGIANAEWPARLQLLRPGHLHNLLPHGSELWVDGAHNAAAAEAVAAFFRRHRPAGRPFHLVFGLLSDRTVESVLSPFLGAASTIQAIPVPSREFHAPDEIAGVARTLGLAASPAAGVEDALGRIARDAEPGRPPAVLILGSLYLAGEVLRKNGQAPA